MNRGRLLILLIAFATYAEAQNPVLDYSSEATRRNAIADIRGLLIRAKTDTAKAKLMRLLAGRYSFINRDSSLWYFQKSLAIYQRANDVNGEVKTMAEMAQELAQSGSYSQSLATALNALQKAERSKDTLNLILATRSVWRSYFFMDEYAMCLEYARKVKVLVESGYFKDEKEKQSYSLFGYMNGIAEAFLGLHQMDSAFYYGRLAHVTAYSLMDPQHLAIINVRMGRIHSKMGNRDSAFRYWHVGIPYAMQVSRDDLVSWAYLGMAKQYAVDRKTDSALHYGGLALRGYRRIKRPIDELETVSFLAEVYAKENKIDSAYKYQSLTITLKDSLFNQEKVKGVQDLRFGETLRIQQLEQERKEAQEKYANRMKVYGLLAIVALVLLIAFFLYRNNKIRKRANLQLQEQKRKVEAAYTELKATQAQLIQQEKMASLGEMTAGIAHEIQNPLNFVNNFAEVNKDLLNEMEENMERGDLYEIKAIAADIKENNAKIHQHGKRADNIVKSMLQHSRQSAGEKEATDINALVEEHLRLTYLGARAKDNSFRATLHTHYDPAIGKVNVVPQNVGRVLINLFNNAFYAVREKKQKLNGIYEPEVTVTTVRLSNCIEIKIGDNGTGIPEKAVSKIFQPFFTTKPTGEGTGLGLSLSYDIITKGHGGDLRVHSTEGQGTEFVVELPFSLSPEAETEYLETKRISSGR